jgi:(1->4)-alpha-D-glucan 1-alpha-D-glucosylmutase
MSKVLATQRIQFHSGFTLDDAVPLIPYFARLGITHLYASPLLKARPGSTHGYDVADPGHINPELGGEPALRRLVAALREHDMGIIVDFVPNHMVVGGDANPWWLDVMEWGVTSPFAHFFDIQWQSPDPAIRGQLLVPFLRSDYGEVLAAGEVVLHFERESGAFYCNHYDHRFPICPATYDDILRRTDHPQLLALADQFAHILADPDYWQSAQTLRAQLSELASDAQVMQAIDAAIRQYQVIPEELTDHCNLLANPQLNNLHELLELQHYRIASWRTAADDINWRRFFDINELGGLRVERRDVFEATHAKIFELVTQGLIDGLRIDHVDGLADPRGYCRKLRRRLDCLRKQRPAALAQDRLPIYVEKILANGEHLRNDWLVEGTTGYEFMNQVSLLQHHPLGEFLLYDLWSRISGRELSFMEEVREARAQLLSSSLAGDFEMVCQGLLQIARTDIATRDVTLGAIRRALFELIVHFTVYRTYAGACGRSAEGEAFFSIALEGAHNNIPEAEWPLLERINRWLGAQPLRELPPGAVRKLRKKVLARFQQLTSPAAAKAVEDTACYRSAALLSRNDVGFDPQHFSAPLDDFHQAMIERARSLPASMLTTATHDHKRGEDSRARLAVLSEKAVWWVEKVDQWHELTNMLRTDLEDGVAPSPGDELILYQTLVGSWPLELAANDDKGLEAYLERLLQWQEKALREAKLRTSWSSPHSVYENACREYLTRLLRGEEALEIRRYIAEAAQSIAVAGALNGLAQCLLRMTVPGMPDLYQGCEFWDFTLVDPDNRRPVDFNARVTALDQQQSASELLENWRDGRIKQHLVARTLAARKAHPELFAEGDYQALEVAGPCAEQIIAFARRYQNNWLIVIIPRLAAQLLGDQPIPLIPAETWGDTQVILPAELAAAGNFESLFGSEHLRPEQGRITVQEALAEFPLSCLLNRERT